jgi:two-component system, OmpR family, phosphate regulon sensor histidine kinase PhoR
MKFTQQAVRVGFTPVLDRSSGVSSVWNSQTEERNRSCLSECWSEASWLGAIAQQSSDLIGTVSLDGEWLCLNPSGRRLLGEMPSFELDEARWQLWNDTILPKLYETGEWRGKFALLGLSGRIELESQWLLMRDRVTDQPVGFATISRVKPQEGNQQKACYLADTAHELKTPLAVISTSIDILQATIRSESEQQHKHFQRIRSKVKQIAQTLEDILLLSRTEHIEFAVSPVAVNLVQFCAELVEEAQASTSQHEIIFSSEASTQVAQIDFNLLERIVANLLSNSIKYSPQGGTIQCHLKLEPNSLILQVADQGIGIPMSEQSQLFQAFYRARNARAIPGTGLGLAIVKRCVDLLGGQIAIQSAVDAGTCFTVQIPI